MPSDRLGFLLWALFAAAFVAAFATVTDPQFVRELGDFVVFLFTGCADQCP